MTEQETKLTQCDTSPWKRPLLRECLHGAGPVTGKQQDGNADKSCSQKTWRRKKTTALLTFDLLWCSIVIFEYVCHPLYRCVYLFCFFFIFAKPSFSSSIIEIKAVCCAPPHFQFCNHPQLAHPSLPAFKMLICCHDQYVIIPHYSSLNLFGVLMKPCEHGVLQLMTQEQKSFRASFFKCHIEEPGWNGLKTEFCSDPDPPRDYSAPQLTSVVAIRVKKRVADPKSEALTERHTCSWCEDSGVFFCSNVCRKKITRDHGRGIIYFTSAWWDFHSHRSSSDPGPAAPLRQVADGTHELQILKMSFFTDTQKAAALHAGRSAGKTVDRWQAKTA